MTKPTKPKRKRVWKAWALTCGNEFPYYFSTRLIDKPLRADNRRIRVEVREI